MKAIIYDLDNTIFPTSGIKSEVAEPVLHAIKQANEGYLDDNTLNESLLDCYRLSIRDVVRKYDFNQKMIDAAYGAFSTLKLDYQLEMYPDYHLIKEISGLRFLVTSGYHDFQALKIDNLNIRLDFEEVFIHDNHKSSAEGKVDIFREILQKYQLDSSDVFVIGDNPSSEIAAGNLLLQMPTIQILRAGVLKSSDAKYHINDFTELKQVLN